MLKRLSCTVLPVLLLVLAACSDNKIIVGAPGIDVDPDEISFGTVSLGTTSEQFITITNIGTAPLLVSNIYLLDKGADAAGLEVPYRLVPVLQGEDGEYVPDLQQGAFTVERGGVLQISVRFTPLSDGDAPPNVVEIENEVTDNPIQVPITGTGSADPVADIQIVPASHDFGTVDVGTLVQQTFVVSNTGSANLTLGTLSINGDPVFNFGQPLVSNVVIPPAGSADMIVTFNPQSMLPYQADVLVPSDDPDEPIVTVPLNGLGGGQGGAEPVCDITATSGATWDSVSGTWFATPLSPIVISGAASFSPSYPANQLTYQWTLLQRPQGSAAALNNNNQQDTGMTPDLAGIYQVRLQVSDPANQISSPCDATFNAIPAENFRVEMFWTQPDDMDLHLVRGGGTLEDMIGNSDCYYANCQGAFGGPVDWGVVGDTTDNPRLDLDDIPGTGPENINIDAPVPDDYRIYVHDYPGTVDYYSQNPTTIRVYLNGVLAQTVVSTDDAATSTWGDSEGNYWKVATIAWPTTTITLANTLCGTSVCP